MSENYTNGLSTSTGMGIPYERQQAFVRTFGGNFIMTRTVGAQVMNKHMHNVEVLSDWLLRVELEGIMQYFLKWF